MTETKTPRDGLQDACDKWYSGDYGTTVGAGTRLAIAVRRVLAEPDQSARIAELEAERDDAITEAQGFEAQLAERPRAMTEAERELVDEVMRQLRGTLTPGDAYLEKVLPICARAVELYSERNPPERQWPEVLAECIESAKVCDAGSPYLLSKLDELAALLTSAPQNASSEDLRALDVLTEWLMNEEGETDLIQELDFWDGVRGKRKGMSR